MTFLDLKRLPIIRSANQLSLLSNFLSIAAIKKFMLSTSKPLTELTPREIPQFLYLSHCSLLHRSKSHVTFLEACIVASNRSIFEFKGSPSKHNPEILAALVRASKDLEFYTRAFEEAEASHKKLLTLNFREPQA